MYLGFEEPFCEPLFFSPINPASGSHARVGLLELVMGSMSAGEWKHTRRDLTSGLTKIRASARTYPFPSPVEARKRVCRERASRRRSRQDLRKPPPSASTERILQRPIGAIKRRRTAQVHPAASWQLLAQNMCARWSLLRATNITPSGLAVTAGSGISEMTALRANFGFSIRST